MPPTPAAPSAPVHHARVRRQGAILVAVWLVPAAFMALQMFATAVINGTPVPPPRALVPALAEWLIWVPLTPVIMRLARRYPIAWPPAAKSLVVHAPGIGAAACLRGTVYAGATYLVVGGPVRIPFGSYLWRVSLAWLPIGRSCGVPSSRPARRWTTRGGQGTRGP